MPVDWSPFVEFVRSHQKFVLLTHVRPDGDALGSQLGMADILAQLGKSSRVVIGSPFPERYRFLDPEHRIERYLSTSDCFSWGDAVIVLDTGTWNQLGDCGAPMKASPAGKFVIDHHRTQDDLGATRIVDVEAEATGRLVWDASQVFKVTPRPLAATALFAALAMDTGWFYHSNMKPETFVLAAELTRLGANPSKIHEELYEANSLERMRLQGRMLDRLTTEFNGAVAFSEIYLTDYAETGAHPMDTEDFVQHTRSIIGVELGLLLIEQHNGTIKASFRSRQRVDCSKLAERFAGGGHARASGATLPGPMAQARQVLRTAIAEVI